MKPVARLGSSALPVDFADMLQQLRRARAEYLVIGGWAVAFHGHQRMTKDIDIFINPTLENARRVIQALTAFGAPMKNVSERDLSRNRVIFQVGVAPVRIDITTLADGITFEEARAGAIEFQIGRLRVPVIGLKALLKNKKASGRPQDLADVVALKKLVSRKRPK